MNTACHSQILILILRSG